MSHLVAKPLSSYVGCSLFVNETNQMAGTPDPQQLAVQMIPGLNVMDALGGLGNRADQAVNSQPTANSRAAAARQAAQLRVQRLTAQRDALLQQGDHHGAADIQAFLDHLNNGGTLVSPQAAPAAPAVSPRVASRRNALAGMLK